MTSIGHPIPTHIKLYGGILEALYDYLSNAVKNEIPRLVATIDLDKCSDADATESDATESATKKPQAKKRKKSAKSSTTLNVV